MSYIKAAEIGEGDVLRIPARLLLGDGAGQVCEIRAEQVAHQRRVRWNESSTGRPDAVEIVTVTHSMGRTTTWFYADEPVVRVTRGPS